MFAELVAELSWAGRAQPRPAAQVCPHGHSSSMWLGGRPPAQLPHLDTYTLHLRSVEWEMEVKTLCELKNVFPFQ